MRPPASVRAAMLPELPVDHMHYVYVAAGVLDTVQLAIIGTSFLSYLVFKLYEPQKPEEHMALLLGIPFGLWVYLYVETSQLLYSLILAYGGYWALLVMFTTVYRLSLFHPLSSYPGPVIARVTRVWTAYIMTTGNLHRYVHGLHERYGDVVRVGPNELSIRNVDAVFPMYSAKGLPKGPYYSGRMQPHGTTAIINIPDPVEHAARRKTWNRAMNSTALKGYEDLVREKVQELIDGLAKRRSQKIDLSEWMSFFGYDFMGKMAFGTDFGMLRAGRDEAGVWHLLDKGAMAFTLIGHLPWLGKWALKLPQKSSPIAALRRTAQEYIMRRIQQGAQHRDLFHYLMDEDDIDENKPPMPVVLSDGVLAIVAGSDTTSTALSNAWYFLLSNPDVYARLRQEIDKEFPLGSDPLDHTKHANMDYLHAFINETLRLLPPVLSGLQRGTHSKTTTLGSYVVPAYTAVSSPVYSLHRDPRCFYPLPDVFWPDRWLIQDTYKLPTGQIISSHLLVHNRDAFIPFSFGPANCVGKNLALMEVRAVIVAFVQKFDIEVAKGHDLKRWEGDIKDYGVAARGNLYAMLTARF